MTGIAKIDALLGLAPAEQLMHHPAIPLWVHPVDGLLPRIHALLLARRVHPARSVVVLPFAQLLPLATRLWAQCYPDGFAPRFETTLNWSKSLGGIALEPTDISFDLALDTLTAQSLLAQAGLAAQQDVLDGLLVQAVYQLGPLAAGCSPEARSDWTESTRGAAVLGMEGPALAWEAAVARVAVEWAGISAYTSDGLYSATLMEAVDCLLVVQGLTQDPVAEGLHKSWGEKYAGLRLLPLDADLADAVVAPNRSQPIALHACSDAEDEAQRSAACALQHIACGRFPLALVSSDRALTRRVRAMLEGVGVQIRDENGWKLSTSHAGAQLMTLLRACTWNASSDRVLDWVKAAPAFQMFGDTLETTVRRAQLREWRQVRDPQAMLQVNPVRELLSGRKTLAQWLAALRNALRLSEQWDALVADGAGAKMLLVLRLGEPASADWDALLAQAQWAARRIDLAEFTAWVNQVLEGASYSPEYPEKEQVVIVPMSQTLARPFAAMVLAGCDEVRLNPSPEPAGAWTPQQREALGLASRDALEHATRASWAQALQTPFCDVLWRTSDDTGETLLPSSLVQLLQLQPGQCADGIEPRAERSLDLQPVKAPLPTGEQLPVSQLSASAFEDLRNCPYRFFALRQLGLKSVDELDAEVGKRDFGLWLHEVLKRFHEAEVALGVAQGASHRDGRRELLNDASRATTESMALAEGDFLPFLAAWPAVREGYLDWLQTHEASGAVFSEAEVASAQHVGSLQLIGRIDRIDRLADGTALVLDYKTEPAAKTQGRVKDALEDTQIAFYAALLPHDTLQGAYVNVGEREGTRTYHQPDVVEARDALIEGLLHDMAQIAQGAPLPALGDGAACDFCQARGLCRKDFWSAA
jgi:ATP-dependent helicase/nuclease subunit B